MVPAEAGFKASQGREALEYASEYKSRLLHTGTAMAEMDIITKVQQRVGAGSGVNICRV